MAVVTLYILHTLKVNDITKTRRLLMVAPGVDSQGIDRLQTTDNHSLTSDEYGNGDCKSIFHPAYCPILFIFRLCIHKRDARKNERVRRRRRRMARNMADM